MGAALKLPNTDLTLEIGFDREDNGLWLAYIDQLPGVEKYGTTQEEALVSVQELAYAVIADKIEHHEMLVPSDLRFVLAP